MSDKELNSDKPAANTVWSWYKKLAFRILFVFLLAMCIPFTSNWYKNVFTLDWLHPHYRDIYDIARFQPSFRQYFGGRGDYDDGAAPTGNESIPNGKNKHHRKDRNIDSAKTDSSAGGPTVEIHEGGRHHHHRDSIQAGNTKEGSLAIADSGRHHHHRNDTTLVAGETFASGGGNSGRHHHHRDSIQAGNTKEGSLAIADSGRRHHHHHDTTLVTGETFVSGGKNLGRHHHDSATTITDSAGHDSLKTASVNSKGSKKGDNENPPPPNKSFLADYTDWGIAFLIGIAGGLIWTLFDRKSKNYDILYYWIRVVVRYRAGIGIIGFGFTKLFPTQMPYPSLGLLNSNFGDFTAQKIYWMSVGIVPWYQVFGGIVEIAAGTMLFFRKTTTFGAILLAGALGDITYVNYAYDGGVHVYAFYFVFLALIIFADDIPKLYNLLILERYTVPVYVYPDFKKPWLKYTRIGLKALTFLVFFVILTYTEVINFKYDPYKQPSTAGVKQLRGNYHVTDFKINGQEIPYNPLDTVRWQEATFENWTTLTFKVNHPILIDPSNGGGSPMKDIQRTFEITGVAGGQRAFHYYADTIDKVLYLQDKNAVALRGNRRGGGKGNRGNAGKKHEDNWISKTALQHIGDEKKMIDEHAWSTRRDREFAAKTPEPKRNRMILQYSTTDGSRVILSGVNEKKDSIYVVLDRYNKKYTLSPGTLSAGKY